MPEIGSLFGHSTDKRVFTEDSSLPLSKCTIGIEIELENIGRRITPERNPAAEVFLDTDMRQNPPSLSATVSAAEAIRRVGIHTRPSGTRPPKSVQGLSYWDAKEDGSLRNNGVEYVSKKVFGLDINKALTEIEEFLDANHSPTMGPRTSTHIHIDARNMDAQQLAVMTALYVIVERVLFSQVHFSRKSSIFCVPLYSSLRNNALLMGVLRADGASLPDVIISRALKYTAYNLASLQTFGSIEFRHHHGEYRKGPLLKWIRLLLHLKRYAMYSGYATGMSGGTAGMICYAEDAPLKFINEVFRGELEPYSFLADHVYKGASFARELMILASNTKRGTCPSQYCSYQTLKEEVK